MTEASVRLKFQRRPAPVMAEHRPLYKICQVLLVLHLASRGSKSSLLRLHLFNWALKRRDRSQQLTVAADAKVLNVTAWGFDPALAIALRYAIAEELIRTVPTGYELTDAGKLFAGEVAKDQTILGADKALLLAVGKNITETMVDSVAKGWEA
jgi:hypothetical protein